MFEGPLWASGSPKYTDGVNAPGYHFHFITADKKAGGHAWDCSAKDASVEIAVTSNFSLRLPK
jgi:acetolactate decarboxylase